MPNGKSCWGGAFHIDLVEWIPPLSSVDQIANRLVMPWKAIRTSHEGQREVDANTLGT